MFLNFFSVYYAYIADHKNSAILNITESPGIFLMPATNDNKL